MMSDIPAISYEAPNFSLVSNSGEEGKVTFAKRGMPSNEEILEAIPE